jgi:hypothetical protein
MLTVTLHGPKFVAAVLRCMEADRQLQARTDKDSFDEFAGLRVRLVEAKVALADVILEELGIK